MPATATKWSERMAIAARRRLVMPRWSEAQWAAAMLIAAATVFLVLTAFGPLGNGLWSDEIHSVLWYIRPGPSGIWGNYTFNDHMLFELLSWATAGTLGSHAEPVYRFWAVGPAIASVMLLTWWLWRRFGHWEAAAFAVLAATAPLHMRLEVQARGYGIGFLASAVMLIGADELARAPSRRAQVVFAVGSLLGILTLPTFVVSFAALIAILFVARRGLWKVLLGLVAVVAVVPLAFYAPVISAALSQTNSVTGTGVSIPNAIPRLFSNQFAPTVGLLVPHLSLGVAKAIGAAVLLGGALTLWRRGERVLMALAIVPAFATYLLFAAAPFYVFPRYMSILLLPLLTPCAVLLAAGARRLGARGAVLTAVAIVVALAGSIAVLKRGYDFYRADTLLPVDNWKAAGEVVSSHPGYLAVTNGWPTSIDYYTNRPVRALGPERLFPVICSNKPVIFVERVRLLHLSDGCLTRRHAVEQPLPQQRRRVIVWVLPPQAAGETWCLSRVRRVGAPAQAVQVQENHPFINALHGPRGIATRVRVSVLRTEELPVLPGAHGTLQADGSFVAVVYRLTNLGPQKVAPAALDDLFGLTGTGFRLYKRRSVAWLPLEARHNACTAADVSYAAKNRLTPSATEVAPHQTVESFALYATAPAAASHNTGGSHPTLTWTSAASRTSVPLGRLYATSGAGATP